MVINIKKRFGTFFLVLCMCLSLAVPDNQVKAASGSTSVSVSSGSVNIGEIVTVTVKAGGPSGEKTVATMSVSYDSNVLQFVSCSTTYGGGGNSVTATSDSFTVTLKAIAGGSSSISLSASDGVVFDTNEELESMSGSSASVTINNAASEPPANQGGGNSGDSNNGGTNNGGGSIVTPGGSSDAGTLSADNSLKALTLSAGTLSPAFSGKTLKYSATVPNDVTSIAVSATPVNEKAVVESVSNNNNLVVGNNAVKVVVKAENGVTATYTINVTRQPSDGTNSSEKPKEPSSETEKVVEPETETEEPVADITVNGQAYRVSQEFTAEEIPYDFSETSVNYHGTDYKGVSYDKGTLVMLYLVQGDALEPQGKFFIYDNTRDQLYPFVRLGSGEKYVIALMAPVDFVMPGQYLQTAVFTEDGNSITAYQETSGEESEIVTDFSVFYAVNYEGTEGWYQYDSHEGTYQRLRGEFSDEEVTSGSDSDELQEEYAELSARFKKEKSFSRNMFAVLTFVIAVLLIVIINMLLQRQKKDKDDFFDDSNDDSDDDTYHDGEATEGKKKSYFRKRNRDALDVEEDTFEEDMEEEYLDEGMEDDFSDWNIDEDDPIETEVRETKQVKDEKTKKEELRRKFFADELDDDIAGEIEEELKDQKRREKKSKDILSAEPAVKDKEIEVMDFNDL